jgi:glycosyltransferase involved in cell wall biosynthesis
MIILHAIHDFLPRHVAGSEIYAFELARVQASRHHVTVLCAEYDPSRPHGHVAWRVHDGLPVVEIVNNWLCRSFAESYRPPLIGQRIERVLQAVQPDVVHMHNLLNLSFDLPALAQARGVPVVATLHDYSLVCPSGGQRLHRAEQHVCDVIDTSRCARCFRQSPFFSQLALGTVSAALPAAGLVRRLAVAARRHAPALTARVGRFAGRAAQSAVTASDIDERLVRAREVFGQIDRFVAPSSSMATQFVQLGIDASRIRVSDYGFSRLAPRPRQPASRPLRIGFVGTLVWHKGVHVLLDAVRLLPVGSYELKIFGSVDTFPDYVADLQARAKGLPVRFMGGFGAGQTADVYAAIDVLVVPSLWLENSPLVIHEAFMAGVPVVGARMGGIPGLVTDGLNGLLYDAASAPALTAALRRLADRPALVTELAACLPAVKSIAGDSLEWEATYAEVIGARRGEVEGLRR